MINAPGKSLALATLTLKTISSKPAPLTVRKTNLTEYIIESLGEITMLRMVFFKVLCAENIQSSSFSNSRLFANASNDDGSYFLITNKKLSTEIKLQIVVCGNVFFSMRNCLEIFIPLSSIFHKFVLYFCFNQLAIEIED